MPKFWGKETSGYSGIALDLVQLYYSAGNLEKARPYLLESSKIHRKLLASASRYLSEQELYIYTHEFTHGTDLDFSFAQVQQPLSATCFDNVLFYKGFLLNAVSQVNRLALTDSTTARNYSLLKSYHRRLADEYATPSAERDSANVTDLEEKANNLEKELTRTVAGFGEALRQVNWQDVQQKLKSEEAAVEFVRYKFNHPEETDSVMYAALILRPGDTQPQFVPLFEEKQLSSLMTGATGGSNFLKINALYAQKVADNKQKSLYEFIWQPLENSLKGITTIYCSPSGLLHRINLAAIPDANGKVFGDQRQLVVLGSTRQLFIPNSRMQTATNAAYLVGGVRYNTDSTAISYANRGAASRSLEPSGAPVFHPDSISSTRGDVLDYLPATATEVRTIGQMLTAANITTRIDTGFYATEEAFRQLGVGMPSPRIIHLATHGYFFPDPKEQKANSAFGQEPGFKMSEHPMIRSGLILAGAKEAWLTGEHPVGLEDGILTAYEISQMNLSGTELVVLSACETGLGDIVGNEGVYGLQRAFKIAGAKYLMMSLWKVDDRSTQEFMTTFYKHWLTEKQTIPQAFRVTQREMRVKHPSAYDWAGFVLIE